MVPLRTVAVIELSLAVASALVVAAASFWPLEPPATDRPPPPETVAPLASAEPRAAIPEPATWAAAAPIADERAGGPSLEDQANEALAAGDYVAAARHFEALAALHPEAPEYADLVERLRER